MLLKKYKKIKNAEGAYQDGMYKQTYSPFSPMLEGVRVSELVELKEMYDNYINKFKEIGLNFDAWFEVMKAELTKKQTPSHPARLKRQFEGIDTIINRVVNGSYESLRTLQTHLECFRSNIESQAETLKYENGNAVFALHLLLVFSAILIAVAAVLSFIFLPGISAGIVGAILCVVGPLVAFPGRWKLHQCLKYQADIASYDHPFNWVLGRIKMDIERAQTNLDNRINRLQRLMNNKDVRNQELQNIARLNLGVDSDYIQSYAEICKLNAEIGDAKDYKVMLHVKVKYRHMLNKHDSDYVERRNNIVMDIAEMKKTRVEKLQDFAVLEKKLAESAKSTPSKTALPFFAKSYAEGAKPNPFKPWKSSLAKG